MVNHQRLLGTVRTKIVDAKIAKNFSWFFAPILFGSYYDVVIRTLFCVRTWQCIDVGIREDGDLGRWEYGRMKDASVGIVCGSVPNQSTRSLEFLGLEYWLSMIDRIVAMFKADTRGRRKWLWDALEGVHVGGWWLLIEIWCMTLGPYCFLFSFFLLAFLLLFWPSFIRHPPVLLLPYPCHFLVFLRWASLAEVGKLSEWILYLARNFPSKPHLDILGSKYIRRFDDQHPPQIRLLPASANQS